MEAAVTRGRPAKAAGGDGGEWRRCWWWFEQRIHRFVVKIYIYCSSFWSRKCIDDQTIVFKPPTQERTPQSTTPFTFDLVAIENHRLQVRNFITQVSGARKMKHAMHFNVAVSSAGSGSDTFMFGGHVTSDLESTATSRAKRPRFESNHALLEVILKINVQLIDTVVGIREEHVSPIAAADQEGDGTIVEDSFIAVALSPDFKSQYGSMQMSPIQPLKLLVPTNYPSCSPVLLDKLASEISTECEDLWVKGKSRFDRSLRKLSGPMSLEEIARIWDVCTRAVISEHAQLSGGVSFSSKYETWENCFTAV